MSLDWCVEKRCRLWIQGYGAAGPGSTALPRSNPAPTRPVGRLIRDSVVSTSRLRSASTRAVESCSTSRSEQTARRRSEDSTGKDGKGLGPRQTTPMESGPSTYPVMALRVRIRVGVGHRGIRGYRAEFMIMIRVYDGGLGLGELESRAPYWQGRRPTRTRESPAPTRISESVAGGVARAATTDQRSNLNTGQECANPRRGDAQHRLGCQTPPPRALPSPGLVCIPPTHLFTSLDRRAGQAARATPCLLRLESGGGPPAPLIPPYSRASG